MRPLFALALVLPTLSLGCGPGERRGPATELPHAPSEAAGPVAPVAPLAPGDSPFCAAFDVGAVDRWIPMLAPGMRGDALEVAQLVFGPDAAAQLARGPLEGLGLDRHRSAVVSLAPLDPALEPAAADLIALADSVPLAARVPGLPPQPWGDAEMPRWRSIRDAIASGGLAVRVSLPVNDFTRAIGALRRVQEAARIREVAPTPPGFDVVLDLGEGSVVGVSRDATTLVFDLWIPFIAGTEPALGPLAAARARSLRWPSDVAAPGSSSVVMALAPRALSRIALVHSTSMVARALASVDPTWTTRLLAQGLWEARQSVTLAEPPEAPRFERVVGRADLDPVGPRAEWVAALAADAPPFAPPPPGASVTARGARASFQAATGWIAGVHLPGGEREGGLRVLPFIELVQAAGFWGIWLGLPYGPFVLGRAVQDETLDGLAPDRVERAGVIDVDLDSGLATRWALLPAGTTAAAAACVLAPAGGPCQPRLSPRVATQLGSRWARLMPLRDRWVLLRANERRHVDRNDLVVEDAPRVASLGVDGRVILELDRDFAHLGAFLARPWRAELIAEARALRVSIVGGPAVAPLQGAAP